jgi:hypothetical protein
LLDQLENRVDNELLVPCGGLARFLQKSADQLQLLPAALRAGARTEVMRALKEIDVAKLVLGPLTEGATQHTVEQFVKSAWPKALDTGGAKRLLLVIPESATASRLPALIADKCSEQPAVIHSAGGEVVACYEAEQLDLARIAQSLATDDPNCIEVGHRLHTRTDVQWCNLE